MSEHPTKTQKKDRTTYLILVFKLKSLEVFQFTQIPELNNPVLSSGRQIIPIFRERQRRDRPCVARKISQVRLRLQVPNLDDRIGCASAKDQAVRMELGARQSDGTTTHSVTVALGRRCGRDLDQVLSGPDVGEGPVLVGRAGEQVVAERVERNASD